MIKQTIIALTYFVVMTHATAAEVLVRAWADKSYIRATDSTGEPLPETCVFFKGQYHPSAYEDEDQKIPFDEVAKALSKQLKRRHYLMATDHKEADFLLVIHWGQTNPEYDAVDDVTTDIDDETFTFNEDGASELAKRQSAKLIGAQNLDHMYIRSLKRQRLEEALKQDRYFINVIALSIDDLRARKAGDPIPKAKWSTQLSVPTGRIDEKAAFTTMAETGSSFFGDRVDGSGFIRPDSKRGKVTLGELEFIDWDEEVE